MLMKKLDTSTYSELSKVTLFLREMLLM